MCHGETLVESNLFEAVGKHLSKQVARSRKFKQETYSCFFDNCYLQNTQICDIMYISKGKIGILGAKCRKMTTFNIYFVEIIAFMQ